jgi:4-hydroxy-tetrahydrodipicolinate synthase
MASVCARLADSFIVLSGDDAITIPLIALGGRGVISVVSNEIPAEFAELTHAALNGDYGRAREIQRKYQPLLEINFVETSPGPVKFAMSRMGLLEPVWRLPMVPPSPASQEKIERVLESLSLLSGVRV